jgi:hypothetical protein
MPINVGINPKNKPEIARIMDRVSKIIPGVRIHGVCITVIPIPPITIPSGICHGLIFVIGKRIATRSKSKANANNSEAL